MQQLVELSEFGKILVFLMLGIIFILLGYAVNRILKKPVPNDLKNANYECGEEGIEPSRIPFNMRFYIIAILFLLFDVELVFLFPWASSYADPATLKAIPIWGVYNLIEMAIFIGLLLIGLAYVWNKGDLEWIRPKMVALKSNSKVPFEMYDSINNQKYMVKEFSMPTENKPEEKSNEATPAPNVIKAPPFRSAIKKETNE